MASLSELLDQVMNECNFRAKSNYANAASQDERQVFNLANRAVTSILRYPWARLRRFHEITLTSDTVYPLPVDYHGLIADSTRANARVLPVDVNTDPDTWSWLKTRGGTSGIEYRTRFIDGNIEFHNPTAGDVITFEYWSNHPILDVDSSTKRRFTRDSDIWEMDEDLLTYQIIWRFKKAKGLPDWNIDLQESNAYMDEFRGRQAPPKTLNMVRGNQGMLSGEPYTNLWLD